MTASPAALHFSAFLLASALALSPHTAAAQEVAAPEAGSDGEPAASEAMPEVIPEAVTAAEAAATAEDYVAAVIARINSVKLNVAPLQDAGMRGKFSTRVDFTTGSDGRLVSSKVSQSSGSPIFDNVAMAQIRAAEPFPLFAPDMGDAERSFSIDIATDIPEPPPADAPAAEAPADAPEEAPAE